MFDSRSTWDETPIACDSCGHRCAEHVWIVGEGDAANWSLFAVFSTEEAAVA